jgi:hypothetical protein
MSDLKEDITYLRGLAEQGRRGPILGGIFLALAGWLFGAACFVQWGVLTRNIAAAMDFSGHLWLVVSAIFAVLWLALYFLVTRGRKGEHGAANAAFGTIWGVIAIGIVVGGVAMGIVAAVEHQQAVLGMMAPLVFAFYGTGWCMSGAFAKRRWMYLVSAAAFAAALILAALADNLDQLVAMGAALILTLGIPGLFLTFEKAPE